MQSSIATTPASSANDRPSHWSRERKLKAKIRKYKERAEKYADFLGQTLTRAENAEQEVEILRRELANLKADCKASLSLPVAVKGAR